MIILIAEHIYQFLQHHRTVRQIIQTFKDVITIPVFSVRIPYCHIKHLKHTLFKGRKPCKINIIQPSQNIK